MYFPFKNYSWQLSSFCTPCTDQYSVFSEYFVQFETARKRGPYENPCSWQAMIALPAVQSFVRILIHNAILLIITWYHKGHWLTWRSYLAIISSNVTFTRTYNYITCINFFIRTSNFLLCHIIPKHAFHRFEILLSQSC